MCKLYNSNILGNLNSNSKKITKVAWYIINIQILIAFTYAFEDIIKEKTTSVIGNKTDENLGVNLGKMCKSM